MNTFTRILRCHASTDGLTYQRNVALLAFAKALVDLLVMACDQRLEAHMILGAWLDPFLLISPWVAGTMSTFICLSTFVFYTGLVWNSVHRTRHAGWPTWSASLVMVPYAGGLMTLILAFLPPRKHTVWDLI